jgi:hypothetical protein
MGSGFSRERGVEFHPSVKNSILACKIGQAFSLFTKRGKKPHNVTRQVVTLCGYKKT